jgi:hypothetical protein
MSSHTFELGSWVWINSKVEHALPAVVVDQAFSAGESGSVQTPDGTKHELTAEQTTKLFPADGRVVDGASISDLTNLVGGRVEKRARYALVQM